MNVHWYFIYTVCTAIHSVWRLYSSESDSSDKNENSVIAYFYILNDERNVIFEWTITIRAIKTTTVIGAYYSIL